jgi:threonine dehydratase
VLVACAFQLFSHRCHFLEDLVPRISTQTIAAARTRIHREFLDSPQLEDEGLSRAAGARLLCKIEIRNPVGCFKGRGADSFIGTLPAHVKTLVTASAGNFGLALVHAARRHGIEVAVYAAETANPAKIERMRAAGGTVELHGEDFDAAKEYARAVAARMNLTFVEDGQDPAITSGAGTIAMELTESADTIGTMLVPLGNGALLAGIGCWLRAHSPRTRIVGICAEGAPAMAESWRAHKARSTPKVDTIADGIAVRVPVAEALADLDGVVDDVVLVSDDAIKQALYLVRQHLHLVVEPAAVTGVAALLSHTNLAQGLVCTPITGGNATIEQLREWTSQIQ